MRNKKPLPLLENITITDIAAEGKALARVENMVVFVPFASPGDIVDIQVFKKKHHYMEGQVVKWHHLSDKHLTPFCKHFGTCGGCKWQHLPYADQLHFKQQQVYDQLVRIGKLEVPVIEDIIGSDNTTFYRNKLEYTFSHSRWLTSEELNTDIPKGNGLGFHIPGMFDKVLDIETCYLQADPSNAIRNEIRRYAIEHNLSFYNLRSNEGFLRTMVIRTSSTGELMLIVVMGEDAEDERNALLEHIKLTFPQITSLLYVINTKANDTIGDQDVICFSGREFIEEQMEGLRFKVGPKSFYQTNSQQAHKLYSVAREFAQLTGTEVVYDLYTGTGTIANFVARNAMKVVGIEYVPEAIEDAHENSVLNGIHNTVFFAGDMKDVLNTNFIARHGKPDVVIVDPPRAGMHPGVVQTLIETLAPRIVYVSCNPATQARDIALMKDFYKIIKVQPVDMFPHTHHVENVVLLEKI
jgi:23S rRNA (uracil1939-C5)-methyltransferase